MIVSKRNIFASVINTPCQSNARTHMVSPKESNISSKATYLDGQLILAMPGMQDPRFDRSVIYICSHNEDGAMGLVVNDPLPEVSFKELLEQLDIDVTEPVASKNIHRGGPVEAGRGFVLHSADYVQETTLVVSETLALSATVDVLKAIGNGAGPKNCIVALGYAGWGAGQLEQEIVQNSWIHARADDEIIFHTEAEDKWPRAMAMLGINLSMLSNDSGQA